MCWTERDLNYIYLNSKMYISIKKALSCLHNWLNLARIRLIKADKLQQMQQT